MAPLLVGSSLFIIAFASCSGDDADPGPERDAGVALDVDASTPDDGINACGGTALLPGLPGESCGACGDGRWRCESPDVLTCTDASAENACGGCGALAGEPGDTCGPCGATWICSGDAVRCDVRDVNACGGCAPLDGLPNYTCIGGILTCDGADALACRATAGNACGGTASLAARPGDPCGTCENGRTICVGTESITCADPDLGLNACGGCTVLQAPPGSPCGCGGTWICSDDGVRCVDSRDRNACGGCGALSAEPGSPCNDSGQWRCDGAESVVCDNSGATLCGGSEALEAEPGIQCGTCGDGVWQCRADGVLACVGETPLNACRGCGALPGEPGTLCGPDRLWECEDGNLRCVAAVERNACGGVTPLEGPPGEGCGPCGDGLWICIGREAVACLGSAREGENVCGGCAALPPGAVPGGRCGVCQTGRWTCSSPDAIACEGEIPERLRTWYADVDGDTWGDPSRPRDACAEPAGWVARAGDCNDLDPDIRPGQPDVCDNADNDCDGVTDPNDRAWRDTDGDGFGDPAVTTSLCRDAAGWVRNDGDCDDTDPRVFAGQTLGFAAPRSPGNWDYDCNGRSEPALTDFGQCGNFPACANPVFDDPFVAGWLTETIPPCGSTDVWLSTCTPDLGFCAQDVEARAQQCR